MLMLSQFLQFLLYISYVNADGVDERQDPRLLKDRFQKYVGNIYITKLIY